MQSGLSHTLSLVPSLTHLTLTPTPRQVSFGGDPEAALVTFSNPAEAKAAYKCTEAVLNNRFIKVFWHNKEREDTSAEVRIKSFLLFWRRLSPAPSIYVRISVLVNESDYFCQQIRALAIFYSVHCGERDRECSVVLLL